MNAKIIFSLFPNNNEIPVFIMFCGGVAKAHGFQLRITENNIY